MADDGGYRSSQEYSGTVEDASIAIPGNAADVAAVISSGSHTKLDRKNRKADQALNAVISSGKRAQEARQAKKDDMARKNSGGKDSSSVAK